MKRNIIPILMLGLLGFSSCSDVLDRPSLTQEQDDNFWTSEDKVRLYANDFYTYYFPGYGKGWTVYYAPGINNNTFNDDVLTNSSQANFTRQVPTSIGSTSESVTNYQSQYCGPTWDFAMVRKANIMLSRIQERMSGVLTPAAYKHWTGIGRLFRGMEYSRLVNVFGDVPYYNRPITNVDKDEIYKDRTPRKDVMDSVYNDFTFALQNVRLNDGDGFINRYIAAALIARYALYEGSWQKYYYNDNERAIKFFKLATDAANVVISSGKYQIETPYRELFCSYDLTKKKDVLLYRKYDAALGTTHCIASYCNVNEALAAGATKNLIESFNCVDGKSYQESTVANANKFTLDNLIRTRDPRFEATFYDSLTIRSRSSLLYVVKFIPRTALNYIKENSTPATEWTGTNNVTGFPVIRYSEVLLNWIEAKAELETLGEGAVSQQDLDLSVNAIRDRPLDNAQIEKGLQKTAHLDLTNLPNDPNRDGDVPRLLWEIRRERRMEFAFEPGRIIDLRRWHKLNYMDTDARANGLLHGTYVDLSSGQGLLAGKLKDYVGKLRVRTAAGTYVTYDGTNASAIKGWFQAETTQPRLKYLNLVNVNPYLCPIGTNQIIDYANRGYHLTQTTGWPSTNN